MLITWNLWKERNRRTFDSVSRSVTQLYHLILEEKCLGQCWVPRPLVAARAPAVLNRLATTGFSRTNLSLVRTPVSVPPFHPVLCVCVFTPLLFRTSLSGDEGVYQIF